MLIGIFVPVIVKVNGMAREDGLYRQRYCGCLPSLELSDFKEQIKLDLAALAE
ncbi:MAG: hypothetical protein ACOX1A_03675 [Saccharofermentanales bacterium]